MSRAAEADVPDEKDEGREGGGGADRSHEEGRDEHRLLINKGSRGSRGLMSCDRRFAAPKGDPSLPLPPPLSLSPPIRRAVPSLRRDPLQPHPPTEPSSSLSDACAPLPICFAAPRSSQCPQALHQSPVIDLRHRDGAPPLPWGSFAASAGLTVALLCLAYYGGC